MSGPIQNSSRSPSPLGAYIVPPSGAGTFTVGSAGALHPIGVSPHASFITDDGTVSHSSVGSFSPLLQSLRVSVGHLALAVQASDEQVLAVLQTLTSPHVNVLVNPCGMPPADFIFPRETSSPPPGLEPEPDDGENTGGAVTGDGVFSTPAKHSTSSWSTRPGQQRGRPSSVERYPSAPQSLFKLRGWDVCVSVDLGAFNSDTVDVRLSRSGPADAGENTGNEGDTSGFGAVRGDCRGFGVRVPKRQRRGESGTITVDEYATTPRPVTPINHRGGNSGRFFPHTPTRRQKRQAPQDVRLLLTIPAIKVSTNMNALSMAQFGFSSTLNSVRRMSSVAPMDSMSQTVNSVPSRLDSERRPLLGGGRSPRGGEFDSTVGSQRPCIHPAYGKKSSSSSSRRAMQSDATLFYLRDPALPASLLVVPPTITPSGELASMGRWRPFPAGFLSPRHFPIFSSITVYEDQRRLYFSFTYARSLVVTALCVLCTSLMFVFWLMVSGVAHSVERRRNEPETNRTDSLPLRATIATVLFVQGAVTLVAFVVGVMRLIILRCVACVYHSGSTSQEQCCDGSATGDGGISSLLSSPTSRGQLDDAGSGGRGERDSGKDSTTSLLRVWLWRLAFAATDTVGRCFLYASLVAENVSLSLSLGYAVLPVVPVCYAAVKFARRGNPAAARNNNLAVVIQVSSAILVTLGIVLMVNNCGILLHAGRKAWLGITLAVFSAIFRGASLLLIRSTSGLRFYSLTAHGCLTNVLSLGFTFLPAMYYDVSIRDAAALSCFRPQDYPYLAAAVAILVFVPPLFTTLQRHLDLVSSATCFAAAFPLTLWIPLLWGWMDWRGGVRDVVGVAAIVIGILLMFIFGRMQGRTVEVCVDDGREGTSA